MSGISDILAAAADKHEAQMDWLRTVRLMAKATVWIDGLEIICAYQTFGKYIPANRDNEAEYPELSIYSISMGGNWLSAADTRAWLERLPDLQELLEEAVFDFGD